MNKARNESWAEWLHTVLFSLNIGFAITLGIGEFTYSGGGGSRSASYLLRPGERVFLQTAALLNQFIGANRGDKIGREAIAFVFPFLMAGALVFLLNLTKGEVLNRVVLHPLGGLTAVALVPAFLLYVNQATWMPTPIYTFWMSSQLSSAAIKVSLVCAFFYLKRKTKISIWWDVLVLTSYYCLWILTPLDAPLLSLKLLFIVFPLSGFAWLFYSNVNRSRPTTR
jgi:hypothetical protein